MKTSLQLATALMILGGLGAARAEPVPQVNAMFRVVKADGNTVAGAAAITPSGGGAMATINVKQSDAIAVADGRCAFNVKYDEVANTALTGTTNRLYSNDALVAQNTAIDLSANVLRTIWTQAYLFKGSNNVKVVINATGAVPSVGWVRVVVDGTCAASASPPAVTPPKPPAAPAPAVVPGSSAWNALNTAWGYSNYAVTQLRGKGYAGYGDVVRLNADLTAVVNAKRVERAAYDALMARWTALNNQAAFKEAMAKITPPAGRL